MSVLVLAIFRSLHVFRLYFRLHIPGIVSFQFFGQCGMIGWDKKNNMFKNFTNMRNGKTDFDWAKCLFVCSLPHWANREDENTSRRLGWSFILHAVFFYENVQYRYILDLLATQTVHGYTHEFGNFYFNDGDGVHFRQHTTIHVYSEMHTAGSHILLARSPFRYTNDKLSKATFLAATFHLCSSKSQRRKHMRFVEI